MHKVQKAVSDLRSKYGITGRAMTEVDFFRICETEKITVIWSDEQFFFTFTEGGKSYIVLPKRERGTRRLLVPAFHELGHVYLKHEGSQLSVLFDDMELSRQGPCEAEADYFAELLTGLTGSTMEVSSADK